MSDFKKLENALALKASEFDKNVDGWKAAIAAGQSKKAEKDAIAASKIASAAMAQAKCDARESFATYWRARNLDDGTQLVIGKDAGYASGLQFASLASTLAYYAKAKPKSFTQAKEGLLAQSARQYYDLPEVKFERECATFSKAYQHAVNCHIPAVMKERGGVLGASALQKPNNKGRYAQVMAFWRAQCEKNRRADLQAGLRDKIPGAIAVLEEVVTLADGELCASVGADLERILAAMVAVLGDQPKAETPKARKRA